MWGTQEPAAACGRGLGESGQRVAWRGWTPTRGSKSGVAEAAGRIKYLNAVGPEAWKEDWPAVAQGAGAEGGKGKI